MITINPVNHIVKCSSLTKLADDGNAVISLKDVAIKALLGSRWTFDSVHVARHRWISSRSFAYLQRRQCGVMKRRDVTK